MVMIPTSFCMVQGLWGKTFFLPLSNATKSNHKLTGLENKRAKSTSFLRYNTLGPEEQPFKYGGRVYPQPKSLNGILYTVAYAFYNPLQIIFMHHPVFSSVLVHIEELHRLVLCGD